MRLVSASPAAHRRDARRWSNLTRYGGAAGVLAVGYDHYDQLTAHFYSVIPTIGPLFVLTVIGAGVSAAMLLAPVPERFGLMRRGLPLAGAVAGIGLAAGSLVGLVLSETTGVFGFRESGVRPALELAGGLDVVTIVLLAGYVGVVVRSWRRRPAELYGSCASSQG